MKPLYVKDWHQCRNCLCVRPVAQLLRFGVVDPVLKLTHDAYECKERPLCERLKAGRKEHLDNEAAALKRDIARHPIGGHPQSRKRRAS